MYPSEPDSAGACVILIGVPSTVRQWAGVLPALPAPPRLLGCLLPSPVSGEELGAPILGDWDQAEAVIGKLGVSLAFVSIPMAMVEPARRLTARLDRAGVAWRFLPCMLDQVAGRVRTPLSPAGAMRPLDASGDATRGGGVAYLIDRQPRALDEESIRQTLRGRVVMITGAGGSIGSELARLVAGFEPARLVLAERAENALFEVDRQIARLFPRLQRAAVMLDVTNAQRTEAVVMAQKPAVIFHAAAHKHVPMMEDHPADAIENNFFGTRSIADAAARNAVERFVMISSDKAVNPSSVMGATKRLAELYIQHLKGRSDTNFSMVRFGNVLGSACSVLPIWTQQLSHGGPITVTSPEMFRYFMTIPEAAGLVLQSAAFSGADGGGGGEVFLLDMGKPIRVLDMARRFLRAQGLEPGVDIQIQITGPRPGEKLFEELAYDGEDMLPTPHESIRIWRSTAPPDERRIKQVITAFDRLRRAEGGQPWEHASRPAIFAALHMAVPEMVQPIGVRGATG